MEGLGFLFEQEEDYALNVFVPSQINKGKNFKPAYYYEKRPDKSFVGLLNQ